MTLITLSLVALIKVQTVRRRQLNRTDVNWILMYVYVIFRWFPELCAFNAINRRGAELNLAHIAQNSELWSSHLTSCRRRKGGKCGESAGKSWEVGRKRRKERASTSSIPQFLSSSVFAVHYGLVFGERAIKALLAPIRKWNFPPENGRRRKWKEKSSWLDEAIQFGIHIVAVFMGSLNENIASAILLNLKPFVYNLFKSLLLIINLFKLL